jgi:hypothetical protein
LLQVGGLCSSHQIDLSARCAPAAPAHAFCAVERLRHLEYLHDHVRIESMLFDGTLSAAEGALRPDPSTPGFRLSLRLSDLADYQTHSSQHPCRWSASERTASVYVI